MINGRTNTSSTRVTFLACHEISDESQNQKGNGNSDQANLRHALFLGGFSTACINSSSPRLASADCASS